MFKKISNNWVNNLNLLLEVVYDSKMDARVVIGFQKVSFLNMLVKLPELVTNIC